MNWANENLPRSESDRLRSYLISDMSLHAEKCPTNMGARGISNGSIVTPKSVVACQSITVSVNKGQYALMTISKRAD